MTDILQIRPWRQGDLDRLRASEALFAPETYPRRFLAGDRRLRPLHLKVLDRMSTPGLRWMGQIGLERDRVVALAECAWDPADPDSPAVVLNVAEEWQPSSIGRRTLRRLVDRCRDAGFTTLNVDYVGSNTGVEALTEAVVAGTGYALTGVTGAGLGHLTVRR